ncbi:MAG TPA: hypothetical protein VK972_03695, partial [Wenzhouxiangella sp.]|nr:hypothetical protein [Wenzhouxiangella sp.]
MKITMRETFSASTGELRAGNTYSVPESVTHASARRLIARGLAVEVDGQRQEPMPERAVAEPAPETAVRR